MEDPDNIAGLIVQLLHDGAAPAIARVLRLISGLADGSGAALAVLHGGQRQSLVSHGLPLGSHMPLPAAPSLVRLFTRGGLVEDAKSYPLFADCRYIHGPADWNVARVLPLDISAPDLVFAILVGSRATEAPPAIAHPTDLVLRYRDIVADEVGLVRDLALAITYPRPGPASERVAENRAPFRAEPGESTEPIADFLFGTLLHRPRIRSRNNISYTALRAWKKMLKPDQVKAIKLLKRSEQPVFEQRVAEEFVAQLASGVGNNLFDAVVPVPCGHSGDDCLTRRLSHRVAQRIGVPRLEAFEPLAQRGTSHPRTNLRRPRMKLRDQPRGRLLLVDDIAASGAHVEEALTLLRTTAAASAVAIVWVAD